MSCRTSARVPAGPRQLWPQRRIASSRSAASSKSSSATRMARVVGRAAGSIAPSAAAPPTITLGYGTAACNEISGEGGDKSMLQRMTAGPGGSKLIENVICLPRLAPHEGGQAALDLRLAEGLA